MNMAKNPVTHQKGSNRKVGKRILSRWQLYLLLLLPVLRLIIFAYVPMSGLVLAFKKYNAGLGVWGSPWAGLDNFSKFFNSFKFSHCHEEYFDNFSFIPGSILPHSHYFCPAAQCYAGQKYKKVIQTVTYVPYFISTVVMVGLIFQLLDYRNGLYGSLYSLFTGKTAPNILSEGSLFKHIYVWSGVWQSTGYSAIIYIAALSGVDQSLHEAAMIDGASRFHAPAVY